MGNFQIIKLWWDKSHPNLPLSVCCWVLPPVGWWHIKQAHGFIILLYSWRCTSLPSLRCLTPQGLLWHQSFPSSSLFNLWCCPCPVSYSSSCLHLFSSFWNTYVPPLWFPFALTGFTSYESQFYLWLQLSLMYSLRGAPLTMFYCFHVLGESTGQEEKLF